MQRLKIYLTVLHSRILFQSNTEQHLLANSVVGVVAVVTVSVDCVVCLVCTVVTLGAIEETVVEPLRNRESYLKYEKIAKIHKLFICMLFPL